jgi:hypothetical protein
MAIPLVSPLDSSASENAIFIMPLYYRQPLRVLRKIDILLVIWRKNLLWGLGAGVYNRNIWALRFSTASGGHRP